MYHESHFAVSPTILTPRCTTYDINLINKIAPNPPSLPLLSIDTRIAFFSSKAGIFLLTVRYLLDLRCRSWMCVPYVMTVPSSLLCSASFCFFSVSAACCLQKLWVTNLKCTFLLIIIYKIINIIHNVLFLKAPFAK